MSRDVNKIILVGHLGRDPEMRTTASGQRIAQLSVATSRRKSPDSDREPLTDWHRVTCWGALAEIAEKYLKSGDRVYVEGSVQYSQFEKNGVTVWGTDVQAREIVMLGGRRDA